MPRFRLFCSVALLAASACAAPATQSPLPNAPEQADSQSSAARSWMSPEGRGHDLLYVSDSGADRVSVYSYPGGKPLGELTGLTSPGGECVDKAGDVFVTEGKRIREYAHGGTSPIATLHQSTAPVACSVDPTTGNVAAANQISKRGLGSVSIYSGARGMPATYTVKDMYQYYAVAYDDAGNLFVDGVTSKLRFRLAELPKGGKSFARVTVDQRFVVPGNVQWDGANLAIGDQASGTIYRFAIAGRRAMKTGSVTLGSARDTCQFWIHDKTVIGPNFSGANVMYWNYPAGGSPTKTIGGLRKPFGVAVSVAGT
ncbi:MAG TPA: hypothetical protein VIJ77_07100 [Candidatus Tumulicola sp.]